MTKTVIPRIENLSAEEDNNSEEYKLELAVSETTVTDILEEIKQFDRDYFWYDRRWWNWKWDMWHYRVFKLC